MPTPDDRAARAGRRFALAAGPSRRMAHQLPSLLQACQEGFVSQALEAPDYKD